MGGCVGGRTMPSPGRSDHDCPLILAKWRPFSMCCPKTRRLNGLFGRIEVSRSGSSMRKSFALCECLRPHPLPLALDPERTRGALSAGTGRPGRRHSRPWRRGPPLPALRCAQRGASVATGCCARVRGGGGGRPRPFGMLPGRGREAARRDHQPQLVCELMTRETRRKLRPERARRPLGRSGAAAPGWRAGWRPG